MQRDRSRNIKEARLTEKSDIAVAEERASASAESKASRPLRVLHVLAVSIPYLNGYTIRSKYIVETQRRQGLDPVVVTSPFYPGVEAAVKDSAIGDVPYYRIPHPVDAPGDQTLADEMCRLIYKIRGTPGPKRLFRGNPVMRLLRGSWHLANHLLDRRAALAQGEGSGRWKFLKMVPLIVLYPFLLGIQWMGKTVRLACAPETISGRIIWAIFAPMRWFVRGFRALFNAAKHATTGIEEALLLRRFERELMRIAEEVKPDLIHAHSPYRCGIPALRTARQLGIPMVYEVRGLWEESSVAAGRFSEGSIKYRFWRGKEARVMREADAVVVICEQLRQEVVARGAAAERVFVVPNAADTSVFHRDAAAPSDVPTVVAEVRGRLRPHTVGYVGSLRKLEGVDELVKAAAVMVRRGHDVSLLVVGDGPDLPGLKTLAEQEGLADRAVFTGRVPHDLVVYFYDFIDVFVISRPRLRVTEMVTPLKPLEAMAMGKALVISDLPSLREIVTENETGLIYTPGDPEDLADKCAKLLEDQALRQRLGLAAQKWIERERTWSAVLKQLGPAYAAAKRNSAGASFS